MLSDQFTKSVVRMEDNLCRFADLISTFSNAPVFGPTLEEKSVNGEMYAINVYTVRNFV
jgi:hypothetical protein